MGITINNPTRSAIMNKGKNEIKRIIKKYRPTIEDWFRQQFNFEAGDHHWDLMNILLIHEKKNPVGTSKSLGLLSTLEKDSNKLTDDNSRLEYWKKKLKIWEKRFEEFLLAVSELDQTIAKDTIWRKVIQSESVYVTRPLGLFIKIGDPEYVDSLMETRIQFIFKEYHSHAFPIVRAMIGINPIHGRQTIKDVITKCIDNIRHLETTLYNQTIQNAISSVITDIEGIYPWNKSLRQLENLANALQGKNYIKDPTLFIRTLTGKNEAGVQCPWFDQSNAFTHLWALFQILKKSSCILTSRQNKWACDNFCNGTDGSRIDYNNFSSISNNEGRHNEPIKIMKRLVSKAVKKKWPINIRDTT